MNNRIRSTDYLVERALGPIAEFILWFISFIGMLVLFPHFAVIWVTLAVIAFWGFYFYYFVTKKHFLTTVEITESYYRSYSRRKLCCTVDRNETIYFALFKSAEATKNNVPYIAFSNHYLNFGSNQQERLSTYDITHEIIMQYNQTTWHLFDLENWICVGGEYLVQNNEAGNSSSS